MRCEEAKSRMIEGQQALDKRVLEHIKECPICARYAEAMCIMGQLLKDAREAEPVMPLAAVRDRLDMISKRQSTMEKIMLHIRDQYQTRPRLTAGMGLAVAVFLFVVLVPFSYTHTVGWKASLEGIDAGATPSPQLINATLAAAGLDDVYVMTLPGEGDSNDLFIKTPSEKEAREIVRALVAAKVDSAIRVHIKPVVEIRSQSLLAQAVDRVKIDRERPVRVRFENGKVFINEEGIFEILRSSKLTDDLIKERIESILNSQDVEGDGVSVEVKTSEDGETRMMEIWAANVSLSHSLSDIELVASDKAVELIDAREAGLPDSVAVIQLTITDRADTLQSRGVILKITVDKEPEE